MLLRVCFIFLWMVVELFETIEKARSDYSLLSSDDYINSQMQVSPDYSSVVLQIGPSCNLSCSHCYGDFGRHRKERLGLEVVNALLKGNKYTTDICLSDGEPFMEENKEVLKRLAQESYKIKIHCLSNGFFATSEENATNWFRFMQENGWDFKEQEHLLEFGCGITYKVPVSNYHNIGVGLRRRFGKNLGDRLRFNFLSFNEPEEYELLKKIAISVGSAFSEKGELKVKYLDDEKRILSELDVIVDENLMIPIRYRFCDPIGRARGLYYFDFPEREISIEEIPPSIRMSPQVCVAYNGNVGFGDSQACIKEARVYGNVLNEPLIDIVLRARDDPIFQAKQLGDIRFLTYLARESNSDFRSIGRNGCNLCHDFFSDTQLVGLIRERLSQEGVVNAYKKYISEEGFE